MTTSGDHELASSDVPTHKTCKAKAHSHVRGMSSHHQTRTCMQTDGHRTSSQTTHSRLNLRTAPLELTLEVTPARENIPCHSMLCEISPVSWRCSCLLPYVPPYMQGLWRATHQIKRVPERLLHRARDRHVRHVRCPPAWLAAAAGWERLPVDAPSTVVPPLQHRGCRMRGALQACEVARDCVDSVLLQFTPFCPCMSLNCLRPDPFARRRMSVLSCLRGLFAGSAIFPMYSTVCWKASMRRLSFAAR